MTWLMSLFLISFPAFASTDVGFKNESEAGVVISSGNSRSQSLSFKEATTYGWSENMFSLKGSFLQTKSQGVLSAKKWDTTLRYDRELTRQFGVFAAQGVESDRFAGYRQRHNSDLGGTYEVLKEEDKWDWKAEAGYRYSKERRTDGTRDRKSQGRLYTDVERKWNSTVSTRYWIEYLPNFSQERDWLLNSEASMSVTLSKIFSMKTSYLVKYDNQPAVAGTKKSDRTFISSLVAKF